MTDLFLTFITNNPHVGTALMLVGGFRMINKPLLLFLHQLAKESNWPGLESALRKLESSTTWKATVFLANWLASVRLPESKSRKQTKLKELV